MDTSSELREMSDEQLAATLKEACTSLFRLRVQAQTERLDVPSELQRNRKLIAGIKTVQNERKRKHASEAGAESTAG
jgi:large subunit ribosomal protein L29